MDVTETLDLAKLDHLGRLVSEPVTADGVEASTWASAEVGRATSGVACLDPLDALHAVAKRSATFWADPASGGHGFDLLVTPTMPEPPLVLGQFASTPDAPFDSLVRSAPVVAFTAPFNVTGQPAVSLPLHVSADGLPIGVQLEAAARREDQPLRVAAQLEAAAPWVDRRPLVHA